MSSASFTVPSSFVGDADPDFPVGILAALTSAVGDEFAELAGTLATRLVSDLSPGDVVALVETTLAFPSSGAVWCDGVRLTYASAGDAVLEGLGSDYRASAIPAGTLVILDPVAVTTDPEG